VSKRGRFISIAKERGSQRGRYRNIAEREI